MCCCFFSESLLFVGILSRCSNLPGKGRTLALARRVFCSRKVVRGSFASPQMFQQLKKKLSSAIAGSDVDIDEAWMPGSR